MGLTMTITDLLELTGDKSLLKTSINQCFVQMEGSIQDYIKKFTQLDGIFSNSCEKKIKRLNE